MRRPVTSRRANDVTIKEIAKRAGVSIATVSRVMNKTSHPVSDETRRRVQAAVDKFNYATSIYGKGLAGRSNIVGLCISAPLSIDPGFSMSVARIIDGIKGIARENNYHVFLEVDDHSGHGEDRHRFFAGVPLAGVMVVAPRQDNPLVPYLLERRIPFVVVGTRAFPHCSHVDADNVYGGRIAAGHLASLGRKRIGCLGGPTDFAPSTDMAHGFRERLRELGLPRRREWFARPPWSVEGGREAALSMLSLPEPPDAVFAFTDFLALGVLQAAQELGIRVPQDVAVMGYDDFPIATAVHPTLTTFRHPDGEMAAQAMHWLVNEIIPGHDEGKLHRELFRPELVIRESCGTPLLRESRPSPSRVTV